MTQIIQSAFAFILGVALTFFGVVHAVSKFPGSAAFNQLVAGLPTLGAVLFFFLGIAAIVAGVIVLVVSFRQLRYRWGYLRELTSGRRHRHSYASSNGDMEEEHEYAGAYR